MLTKPRFKTFVCVAAILLLPSISEATSTWDGGGGDGLWSNPLNWSGDEVPVGNTQISIGNGAGTVTLDVNFTVFGTGGLKVDGFGASAPTLLVATGRTLRFENSGQIRNTVERDATIRVEGRVEVAAGSEFRAQVFGNFLVAAGGVLDILGAFHAAGLPNDATLVNEGTVNLDGSLSITSIVRNRATLNCNGGFITIRGLANAGNLHNEAGGVLIGTAGTSITVGDPQFDSDDTLINDGSITFPGTLTLNRLITNNGNFDNSGGLTTVACGANIVGTGTFAFGTLNEECKLWDGEAGDGLWSTARNWSLDTVPDGTKNIRIDATAGSIAVTLDVNVTVNSGRTFQLIGPSRLTSFSNVFTIPSGRTLTINGTMRNSWSDVINNGGIVNAGLLRSEGHPSVNTATFDNNGNITNSGTIQNAGSPFDSSTNTAQFGIFTNAATITSTGTITNINGTFENAGPITNNGTLLNNSIFNNRCGGVILGTPPPATSNAANEFLCVPPLVAPPNNATLDTAVPTFSWQNPQERRAVTYRWTIASAAAPATPIRTEPVAGTSFTVTNPLSDGTYLWKVQALFGTVSGDFTPAFTVTIATNRPPIANAGQDQTVHAGSMVTLDGSGSTDPDEDYPLSYLWEIISRPPGSTTTIPDPAVVMPSFRVDQVGDYLIGLVVTDSRGLSSTQSTVRVSTVNAAPVADAGPDQPVITVGTTVTLNGSGSFDPDGDDIAFHWTMVQKPAGSAAALTGAQSATPSFVVDVYGDYLLELVVSDPWATSLADQVTVSFTNIKPVADAGMNQSVFVGDTVMLDGSGSSDVNGDPITHRWTFASKPAASLAAINSASSENANFVPDVPGTYIVSLTVNDGLIDSDPANVTITAVAFRDAALEMLTQVIAAINALAGSDFKNPNMKNTLSGKVNVVIEQVQNGNYGEAIDKLENDVIGKTDGCATTGSIDRNDWIVTCSGQGSVHPLLAEALRLLRNL